MFLGNIAAADFGRHGTRSQRLPQRKLIHAVLCASRSLAQDLLSLPSARHVGRIAERIRNTQEASDEDAGSKVARSGSRNRSD
jgi:hypothetical protein